MLWKWLLIFTFETIWLYIYVKNHLNLMRKVVDKDNALFLNSFLICIIANTFLLLNFTYFNVHLRFAQSIVFVNTASERLKACRCRYLGWIKCKMGNGHIFFINSMNYRHFMWPCYDCTISELIENKKNHFEDAN